MTEPDLELIEQPLQPPDEMPERQLWGAALRLFLDDAMSYREGIKRKAIAEEMEQAYQDLRHAGPQTRRLCAMTGHDADILAEAFRRWCDTV
ncbi:hypothetical protein [Marinobacter sp. MBR-105]|jgi:hypothetical protein